MGGFLFGEPKEILGAWGEPGEKEGPAGCPGVPAHRAAASSPPIPSDSFIMAFIMSLPNDKLQRQE